MKNFNGFYLAYAAVWCSVSIAVIFALYVTKNSNSLWAFLIPAFITLESKKN